MSRLCRHFFENKTQSEQQGRTYANFVCVRSLSDKTNNKPQRTRSPLGIPGQVFSTPTQARLELTSLQRHQEPAAASRSPEPVLDPVSVHSYLQHSKNWNPKQEHRSYAPVPHEDNRCWQQTRQQRSHITQLRCKAEKPVVTGKNSATLKGKRVLQN
jgi:hypothetical protein